MISAERFAQKTVFSLEVFPPKPDADIHTIYQTIDELSEVEPDFISVTYGAAGGKNGCRTIQIASDIQSQYGIESVAHLPCIGLTRQQAETILRDLESHGIRNILALRGDIPVGVAALGDFAHASDLIHFIRERYDCHIIGACYPEVHPESASAVDDIRHLREKTDAGCEHLISQLFLDNADFYRFRDRAELAGIHVPIEAGIMPVTNRKQIERMVQLCGIRLPEKFIRMLDRYEDDPQALRDAGIAYAISQITDLIAHGVDGIHLYTMNQPETAKRIYDAVKSLIQIKQHVPV